MTLEAVVLIQLASIWAVVISTDQDSQASSISIAQELATNINLHQILDPVNMILQVA